MRNVEVCRHIVIIGGGFGGLRAAKTLAHKPHVLVTLIDRHNYHLFQPLLYQVATAGLSPADIAVPIRSVIGANQNTEVILGTVREINPEQKYIRYDGGQVKYDYLIVAAGATHSYFSHPEWEQFAPGLKTLEHATEIRRRVLLAYEQAEIELNEVTKTELLTFVIVGGGPTGVELAGAIAEISRQTLAKDFKNIDPSHSRVVLIEAGDRILAAFSRELAIQATVDLEHMGVEIRTHSRVTEITSTFVKLGTDSIATRTVIWAAGVQPSELGRFFADNSDPSGRVIIDQYLNVKDHPEIFVIGDMANFKLANNLSLPGLAPVAMQQGELAAKNILRQIANKPPMPFKYLDKGMMATIGRKKAIMEYRGFQVSGLLAWIAWLLIHIFYLIDFKNKLFVFLNWCWSYVTFRKGARLIVDNRDRPKKTEA
jgi:NADH dehydrogenase